MNFCYLVYQKNFSDFNVNDDSHQVFQIYQWWWFILQIHILVYLNDSTGRFIRPILAVIILITPRNID